MDEGQKQLRVTKPKTKYEQYLDYELQCRAFNEGGDARLAGQPTSVCPYRGPMAKIWINGWMDVAQYWGVWNPRARPLPAVRVGVI